MSLISKMLDDLDQRQAGLADEKDPVLEGLSRATDADFHASSGKKSLIVACLAVGLTASSFYAWQQLAPDNWALGTVAEQSSQAARPATGSTDPIIARDDTAASPSLPSEGTADTTSAGPDSRASQSRIPGPSANPAVQVAATGFSGAAAKPNQTNPRLLDQAVENGATSSTITLRLSQKVFYRVLSSIKQDRIIVEFNDSLTLPGPLLYRAENGLVREIRGEQEASGSTRIVLDMDTAVHMTQTAREDSGSTMDLILSIAPVTAMAEETAAVRAAAIVSSVGEMQATGRRYHLVKPGETFYSIGQQYGLDYKQLAAANKVNPPYIVHEHQQLEIPAKSKLRVAATVEPQAISATTDASNFSVKGPDSTLATEPDGTFNRVAISADDIYKNGLQLYRSGQQTAGMEQIVRAISQDPSHVEARTTLANCLAEQGQLDRAIELLKEGLDQNPRQFQWAELRAHLLVQANDVPSAIATLQIQLPDAAGNPDYHGFLAALLLKEDRHQEAAALYRTIVQVKPLNGIWWMGLGISLEHTDEPNEALDSYQQALKDSSLSSELRGYISQRIIVVSRR